MGGLLSICTDPNGEQSKSGAFSDASNNNNHNQNDILVEGDPSSLLGDVHHAGVDSANSSNHKQLQASLLKEQQKQAEEDARLALVVAAAGRDMVSVRSTRGANYYHDQGFAAALSQHLQQTLPAQSFQPQLPKIAPSVDVMAVLARPLPPDHDDRRWETLLHQTNNITAKEQLFAKCPQVVERLL
jgi:hypothetical protein